MTAGEHEAPPTTEIVSDEHEKEGEDDDDDDEQVVVVRRKKRSIIDDDAETRDEAVESSKKLKKDAKRSIFIAEEAEEEDESGHVVAGDVDDEQEPEETEETEEDRVFLREGQEGSQEEDEKSESDDEEYEKDDEELDEEDLALIEENLGVKVSRPRGTRLRRFKKGKRQEDTRGDRALDSDQVVVRSTDHEKAREELQSKLFAGEEEDETLSMPAAETSREKVTEDFDSEEDDLSNFIVADEDDDDDEEEEEEELGRELAEKHTEVRKRAKDGFQVRGQQKPLGRSTVPISAGALGDVYDIFGDGSDYAHAWSAERQSIAQEDEGSEQEELAKPTITMEEAFEPSVLKEKYFTNFDEKIRNTDIPERMQLRDGNRHALVEGELEQEALWAASMMMKEKKMHTAKIAPLELIQAIVSVLKFMRQDYLEVPFIARYRKEFFVPQLSSDDLWYIYDADETWKSLYSRKLKLRSMYEWHRQAGSLSGDAELETAIHGALSEEELTDQYDQLKLRHGIDFVHMESSSRKHLSRRFLVRNFYHACKRAGLDRFALKMGISAQQLGSNLSQNRKVYEAEDLTASPTELAREYTSPVFPDPESVLRAARMMAAEEIATEPRIRKFLRNLVQERTLITVRPTEKGKWEIDELHKYSHVKYLSKKPFRSFEDAQFLELEHAEKEEFLRVTFELDPDGDIFAELKEFYSREAYSLSAQEWNEQRALVLREAWDKHLQPLLERYLRNILGSKAIQFLKRLIHRTLSKKLMAGSFDVASSMRSDRDKLSKPSFRVFAIGWLSGDLESVTFGVVLDEHGDVVDHVRLKSMRAANRMDERERKQKDMDMSTLRKFLAGHSPKALVVGPGDMLCRRLFDDVRQIADDLIRDRILAADTPVTFLDDDVARIYQNSESARSEFPDYPPLLRYCISLGRRLIDPLVEYASLCHAKNDLLCLKLHPLQDFLPSEMCANMMTRAFVDVTNAVGVDINLAVTRVNYAPMLQFVAGLGPRKAQALTRHIRKKGGERGGFIEKRHYLLSKSLLKSRVYLNAAPFLHISPWLFGKSQRVVLDVLDNTRIHPEDYELARKMAADALEIEEVAEDEDHPSQYVQEVMMESAKLNDLLLEDYAKELEMRSGIKKYTTLQDIRSELQRPFRDPRHAFEMPTADDVFRWLSSETDFSLHPGLIVPVTITRVQDRSVGCRLDSGLYGVISLREMADPGSSAAHAHPREVFRENSVVPCRVLAVHKDRFSVDLSARPSELDPLNRRWEIAMHKDRYYDWDLDRHEKQEEKLRQTQQKEVYVSRMIHHPLFKNMTFKMAESYLESKQVGDVVIRPSSKGPHHLTLSWKLDPQLIQHIDIVEKDKDHEFALGKSLYIHKERFEDLDEIVARYIEPLSFYVRELARHKNFWKDGACTRDQLAEILRAEKSANPVRIPYYLALSKELPGKAVLSYQPANKARFENIDLTPEGFKLADQVFTNVDALVIWFKQHHQVLSAPAPPASFPSSSYRHHLPPAAPLPPPAYSTAYVGHAMYHPNRP